MKNKIVVEQVEKGYPYQTEWWLRSGKDGVRIASVPSWFRNGEKLANQIAKALEKEDLDLTI